MKWINTIGIALELAGAAWLVVSAWRNKRRVAGLTRGHAEEMMDKTVKSLQVLFNDEIKGFILLATGLLLQMIATL